MCLPEDIKARVLYISYDGLLDPLGQSQIIPYLKGLSKKGIKYIVLSFEKNIRLKSNISGLRKELEACGIVWKDLRYHKSPSALATFFDIFQGVLVCAWFVLRYRIGVVHARSYVAGLMAFVLKKTCRIKFIFDMRGFWADERVEADIWNKDGWLYRAVKYFEKVFLQNADAIVSLTCAAKDEIEDFSYLRKFQLDISCIPTCVDLDRFSYRRLGPEIAKDIKDRPVFVYCGSISTWFMPREMIALFNSFKKNLPQAYLFVITREKELFSKISKSAGLRDDFSVVSAEYDDVADYLSLAQAAIAFYRPGYSRKACCPTKVGEYLACGLPVIINAGIGDCDEILRRERIGLIINEFSNKEYKRVNDELRRLLQDKDLQARCRRTAEKYFALDEGIEQYKKIYSRLIRKADRNA